MKNTIIKLAAVITFGTFSMFYSCTKSVDIEKTPDCAIGQVKDANGSDILDFTYKGDNLTIISGIVDGHKIEYRYDYISNFVKVRIFNDNVEVEGYRFFMDNGKAKYNAHWFLHPSSYDSTTYTYYSSSGFLQRAQHFNYLIGGQPTDFTEDYTLTSDHMNDSLLVITINGTSTTYRYTYFDNQNNQNLAFLSDSSYNDKYYSYFSGLIGRQNSNLVDSVYKNNQFFLHNSYTCNKYITEKTVRTASGTSKTFELTYLCKD